MTGLSSPDRSGAGDAPAAISVVVAPPDGADWVGLTSDPLPVERAVAWVTTTGSGAVVSFLGVVRDHADGRAGVTGLTYESYERAAIDRMHAIARQARVQWPSIERLALLHRVGPLELSDVAVAVVVSTAHRGPAFDAARFCIDTLKETVPIWKREHWAGGSDWGVDARPVAPVPTPIVP